MAGGSRQRDQSGFGAVDALMALVLLGAIVSIAIPVYSESVRIGQREVFLAQAVALQKAFAAYREETGAYPAAAPGADATGARAGATVFSRATLEPLTSTVDLGRASALITSLENGRVTAYGAHGASVPGGTGDDDPGYWVVLTLADDPGCVVLVADTDRYPGSEGRRLRGIFVVGGREIVTYRPEEGSR